jgi:integrase
MPKAKLDYAFAATAQCEPGKVKTDWYDTTVTGFVLECRSSGGRTYYLRYNDVAGRQKQFKIGRFEDVSFAAAKKRAVQLRSEVVMGGDPGAKKAEAKAVPLYRELAAMHLSDAKAHLKSYATTEACMRNHILPKWGKVPVTEITNRAVGLWLAEKRAAGSSPATVERMRVVLGRSYVLGQRWEVPGTDKNPTRGIARKPLNNARERFLSAEEAARLRAAVAASQNTQLQHIVGLLLLTGARVRELLDARWENVDVDRQSWLIPTSKTGKPRHVPLSKDAIAVIEAMPRFKGCPWLVPNPDTLKPFVSIKHSFKRAIKAAKLPGLRIHDLRHSAASFMVNSGVDLFAVGKVLGHASYQSTQRYSHLANDTLLAAVEAGAAKQTVA